MSCWPARESSSPTSSRALASEILEEKTKRFTEQNQTNLSQLLTPLAEKIKSFQQKVEEVYVQEGKDRSALSEQVRLLMGLNQQLSGDTGNLTRALTTSGQGAGRSGRDDPGEDSRVLRAAQGRGIRCAEQLSQ